MFLPDKRHIHHQLLAHGLTQRKAVLILYMVSCSFGLLAYMITAGSINASSIIILLGIGIVLASKKLGYNEILVIKNGILLKFYSFTFMKYRFFRIALDALSVFLAFFFAACLSSLFSLFQDGMRYFLYSMAIICSIQLLAFVLGGLYKHSIKLAGIGDFLQIAKSTLIAIGITAAAVYLFPLPDGWKWISTHSGIFLTLDFYFLITFVAGSRITFHILNYVFNRESPKGKRILIYGADSKGLVTFQALLNYNNNESSPIGFLDDDPNLEGKYLNGYPIFGGHWKLEGLLKKNSVDEVIVASDNINSSVLLRIKRIAGQFNVPVRTSNLEFKPVNNVRRNKIENLILDHPQNLNPNTI